MEAGIPFRKTSDQGTLLQAASKVEPTWAGLAVFGRRPVALGYPGGTATRDEAASDIQIRDE